MVKDDDAEAAREELYDVQLRQPPAESLWSQYPEVKVHTTGSQTAFLRRVSEPAQLDALLDKLRSVGLVLMDVHRLSETPASHGGAGVYEVRVKGELGQPLLRYLRWPHYVVPGQTLVRIASASADLHRFLRACNEAGASIERVRRIDVALSRTPSPA